MNAAVWSSLPSAKAGVSWGVGVWEGWGGEWGDWVGWVAEGGG